MNKKRLFALCGALFASQLMASTIYIGADGNFYDAVTGGAQVSYTSGDTIDWQTGVTTWNVNSNLDLSTAVFATATNKTINIGAGGNLVSSEWLTAGSTTLTKVTLNVTNGGSFSQAFTKAPFPAAVNVSGTSTNRSSFTFSTTVSNLYPQSVYTIGEYVDFKAENMFLSTNNGTSFGANSTVKIGTLQQGGKLTISTDTGSFNIVNNHINAMENSHIVINTANPFKGTTNIAICRGISSTTGASSKIELHADIDLGRVDFTKTKDYSQVLLLDLNGHKITFSGGANNSGISNKNYLTSYEYQVTVKDPETQVESSVTKNSYAVKILIEDFANNSVRFGTVNGLLTNENGSVKNVFWKNENGEEVELFQDSEGWLYSPLVPEPAHWAVIFGALALSFVIWRRRK